jgi:NTE family protein
VGGRQIDSNRLLEQLRFDDKTLTEQQKRKLNELTLGDAVAASACVPGIFHPLAIHDLYQNSAGEEIVVQLVDGGVFDNQGLAALFTADCTHIVCSDASGQMEDEVAPSIQFYNVLKRSNDILMDRVRDDGLQNLFLRERGYQLLSANNGRAVDDALRQELAQRLNVREFAFFYLKDSFPESPGFPCLPGPVDKREGMIYCLSQLRTDLDSFTDLEAYALMYDGYCLSGEHIAKQKELGATVTSVGQQREQWTFLKIREVLSRNPEYLLKHLRVGKQTALKVFLLREPIACFIALLLILAVIPLLWLSRNWTLNEITNPISLGWTAQSITLGQVYIAIFFAFLSLNHTIKKMLKQIRWLRRLKHGTGMSWLYFGVPVLFALVVSVAVAIHLAIFDRLFLRSGRIKQVPAEPQASPGVPSPLPTAGL